MKSVTAGRVVSCDGVCDCLQGGIKAVIWTDTFQSIVMLAGLFAIIVVVTENTCSKFIVDLPD